MNIERNAQRSRDRLDAYRRQIEHRILGLHAELERLQDELAWIDERSILLARLANDRQAERHATVLRGAELREHAVIVLATSVGTDRAMHYRDWYDATLKAGFAVLGKRPTAAFLTTVVRSPFIVRDTNEPGYYRFDPDGGRGLADEAASLREQLAKADTHIAQQQHLSPVMRKHRLRLLASLRRIERQSAEANRILDAYRVARQSPAAA
jgi:hypothetical protein